jgi:hypothetical protein
LFNKGLKSGVVAMSISRTNIDRVLIYAYLICVVVVAIATLDERAQFSQALWAWKPVLAPAANLTEFAFDFAVVGLLVCPTALLILALPMRISRRSAVIGGALLAASLLRFEPHIQ